MATSEYKRSLSNSQLLRASMDQNGFRTLTAGQTLLAGEAYQNFKAIEETQFAVTYIMLEGIQSDITFSGTILKFDYMSALWKEVVVTAGQLLAYK